MNSRLLLFVALLISRVFVTPVWFSLHIEAVKSAAETFEQVRLKKRRSSYIEEDYFQEATLGIEASAIIARRFRLKQTLVHKTAAALVHSFDHFSCSFLTLISANSLFLRNRVLRI